MKKEIQEYISSLGGQSHYSGKDKIMYIDDPKKDQPIQSIEEVILNKFGFSLLFKLQTN